MLKVNQRLSIPLSQIELSAVRAQGSGGQNVNKVSSAIHLRFDVRASSLPETVKQRLLSRPDQRLTSEGVIVIKAQNHRTQERNRAEALQRLAEMVRSATRTAAKRIPTKPGRAAKEKRLQAKKQRGQVKKLRGQVSD